MAPIRLRTRGCGCRCYSELGCLLGKQERFIPAARKLSFWQKGLRGQKHLALETPSFFIIDGRANTTLSSEMSLSADLCWKLPAG